MQNAHETAVSGYARNTTTVRTHRDNEYDAFGQITRELKKAIANKPGNTSAVASAIHRNRELWTLLATQVADESNEIPVELRARIFSLAEFVRKHSSSVLNGDTDGSLLIDINTSIMQGLTPGSYQ